jgi:hypothetical protein
MLKKFTRKRGPKFPTFAVVVLLFAIYWALNELKLININLPWIPIILAIISVGWIANNYR